jgi:hypothetical protein
MSGLDCELVFSPGSPGAVLSVSEERFGLAAALLLSPERRAHLRDDAPANRGIIYDYA